jgi:hypothetical protein
MALRGVPVPPDGNAVRARAAAVTGRAASGGPAFMVRRSRLPQWRHAERP